jgi:hypothetical protein
LFCALGGELFIRYRLRIRRAVRAHADGSTAPEAAA